MANVTIDTASLRLEVSATEGDSASLTSSDTGKLVSQRTILRVVNAGGSDATVSLARNDGLAATPYTVKAGTVEYIPIDDTSLYRQSDGLIDITTNQDVSVTAVAP